MTGSPTSVNNPPLPVAGPRLPPRRSLALSALSGLLLVGAFPHLDWGWLAWVALAPFLMTFPHRRMRDALACGAVFCLMYCGGVSYWVAIFAGHAIGRPLGLVVWAIATVTQSVPMLFFVAGTQWLSRRPSAWAWRLGVPALWTVGEWVRQFGPLGTGWGDLGYTQHTALLPLQLTKLTGVFGLSFLIVLVNLAVSDGTRRRPAAFPRAVAGLVLLVLVFGAVTLRTEHLRPTFAAAALQTNIGEDVLWSRSSARPADPAYTRRVMDTYGSQAQEAAVRGARLVVWPETSFPGYLRSDSELRAAVAAGAVHNQQATLVGGLDFDDAARKAANALFLVDANGNLRGSYHKQILVPFGEYVPFRRWLPFLNALHMLVYDMEPGDARQPLLDAGPPVGKVGVAICYESTDGEIVRRQVAQGANILVVATDDTWFGHTAAPRQHAAEAAVRAAENDRYLIRSAVTGVSQVIAPTGQVLVEGDLFTRKLVLAPVQSRRTLTPYARWGDWFVALCATVLVWLTLPRNGGLLSVRGRPVGSVRSSGR